MKLICEKQRVKLDTMIIILDYYSTNAPFYHIRAKERAKYATLLHCRTGQKYRLKAERQNGRTKLYFFGGIILLVLLIARIFPRPYGARKNTSQLAKYPLVLYAKPSNKVYIIDILIQIKNTCAKTRLTQASEKHDNRKMYQMLGLFQGLLMDHGY